VFINYRGDDSQNTAALIDGKLTARFGSDRVFLDCRSVPVGSDFVGELLERVRTSSVLLVVIGPHWLSLTNEAGERRIDDPNDWVRREIVEAFSHRLRVIPVLLDGAQLPDETRLPDDIAGLSRRQYVPLRRRHIDIDLDDLVARLISVEPELAEVAVGHQTGGSDAAVHDSGPVQISAWMINGYSGHVNLLNRSDQPVYQVVVVPVLVQGAGPQRAEDVAGTGGADSLIRELTVLPPGEWRLEIPVDSAMSFEWAVEIAFTDSKERHWIRRRRGTLERLTKSAPEYFGLDRPTCPAPLSSGHW
jgi:hypothetical protein